MRVVFALFYFFTLHAGWAYEKRPTGPLYAIVSDEVDVSINENTCVVEGIVRDQSGNTVSNALISTIDKSKSVNSGINGKFTLTLPAQADGIFMFHERYGEIVIRDFDFKSQHRVVINFYPEAPYNGIQTVKKPVIYLYSDNSERVTVQITHPGMTFMYPAYDSLWSVVPSSDGTLRDTESAKKYPYLFWEANTQGLTFIQADDNVQGFLISTDSLVEFFESSLQTLGLNSKEQTDFITFWSPQLLQTPFVFVQFLLDADYDELIAPIQVTPEPDSQRRIFMLYTPISNLSDFNLAVNKQILPEFNRSGFTLIEWGGAEVPLEEIFN